MIRVLSPVGFVLLLGLAAAPAHSEEYAQGFTHCAPPFRPPCIDTAETEEEIAACENAMQAYIATVFKYRACIDAESQRAVRDANDAIEAWKCQSGKLKCR